MFQARGLEDGTEWKAVEMLKELKIGSAIDAVENKITEKRAEVLSIFLNKKKTLREEFRRVALPELSHLYTAAFYLTKNDTEAKDLVQETYLHASRFFDKFQPGTNCRAWLLSILRNLFINRYRQRRQEPEIKDWEEINRLYESLVKQGERVEIGDKVEEALRGLPEEYRTAIVLVDIEELSYEEAAKVMECDIRTIRSRVSRGRRMLQVALSEYALEMGLIKE